MNKIESFVYEMHNAMTPINFPYTHTNILQRMQQRIKGKKMWEINKVINGSYT